MEKYNQNRFFLRYTLLALPVLALLNLSACHLDLLDPIKDGLVAGFEYEIVGIGNIVPATVHFKNLSSEAVRYEWDFGDGSPVVSAFEPSHLYELPGDYTVQLRAFNASDESDDFAQPIVLRVGSFSNYSYGGAAREFVNVQQVSDSTYLFSGYHSVGFNTKKQLTLLLNYRGDTLNYYTFDSPGTAYGEIPVIAYIWVIQPTVVTYDRNQVILHTQLADDLFGIFSFDNFGDVKELVYSDDGHAILIGSQPGIAGINFLTVLARNEGQEVYNYQTNYQLEGACAAVGEGSIVVVSVPHNGTDNEEIRILSVSHEPFKINFDTSLESLTSDGEWEVVRTSPDNYTVVGSWNSQLQFYALNDAGKRTRKATLEIDLSISDVQLTSDGGLIILGDRPANLNRTKGVTVVKVSSEFAVEWIEDHTTFEPIFAGNIIQTIDGGFILYAQTIGSGITGNPQPYILKLNEKGQLE